jgi:hypothetical protein
VAHKLFDGFPQPYTPWPTPKPGAARCTASRPSAACSSAWRRRAAWPGQRAGLDRNAFGAARLDLVHAAYGLPRADFAPSVGRGEN